NDDDSSGVNPHPRRGCATRRPAGSSSPRRFRIVWESQPASRKQLIVMVVDAKLCIPHLGAIGMEMWCARDRCRGRSGCVWAMLLACAPLVLGSTAAFAEPLPIAPVKLDYQRAAGAEACPEESFFHNLLASHLGGRDPFAPTASRRLTLTVRRTGRSYSA